MRKLLKSVLVLSFLRRVELEFLIASGDKFTNVSTYCDDDMTENGRTKSDLMLNSGGGHGNLTQNMIPRTSEISFYRLPNLCGFKD